MLWLAGVSVFTAAVDRARRGKRLVSPSPVLAHATDMLRMTKGVMPAAEAVAAQALEGATPRRCTRPGDRAARCNWRSQQSPARIEQAIDLGDRLMGVGHGIYRVRDPRAHALTRLFAIWGRMLVGWLMRTPWRLLHWRFCASASQSVRCKRTSSSTLRFCWKRWASIPTHSLVSWQWTAPAIMRRLRQLIWPSWLALCNVAWPTCGA